MSLPTEAEEIWRYSRIGELDLDRYAPYQTDGQDQVRLEDLPKSIRGLIAAAGPDASLLVAGDLDVAELHRPQPGLVVAPAGDAPASVGDAEPLPLLAGPRADIWTALNGAFVAAPWKVVVEPGVALAAPVVVVHWLSREGAAYFPRLEVQIGCTEKL